MRSAYCEQPPSVTHRRTTAQFPHIKPYITPPTSVYLPSDRLHPLIIDGRDCKLEHGFPVLGNSRAKRLLDKDPRAFGAAVKQLYLSGQAGGAGLRELLAYDESMDTDQPELDSGVASGGATPTLGRGARDAAG